MSFLKSVLFGSEGSYNILGTSVIFEKSNAPVYAFILPEASGVFSVFTKSIAYMATRCLNSYAFRILTQGYAHTFVHEMGHALATRILTDKKPIVRIFTDLCMGSNSIPDLNGVSPKACSIIYISGPMANMTFCGCKLVAAAALQSYISTPVAVGLGTGAVIWMSGELFLAYVSASRRDYGDFGSLAQQGSRQLTLASTALIGQCALGLLAASKFVGVS